MSRRQLPIVTPELTHLVLDEAVAAEVDDGVDVVELKLGADWEP